MKAKKKYDANYWRKLKKHLDDKEGLSADYGNTLGMILERRTGSFYSVIKGRRPLVLIICTNPCQILHTYLNEYKCIRKTKGSCCRETNGMSHDNLVWGHKYRVHFGDPFGFAGVFVGFYKFKNYYRLLFELPNEQIIALYSLYVKIMKEL